MISIRIGALNSIGPIGCRSLLSNSRCARPPKVATGFIANVLCSETFVSGLEPDKDVTETIVAMPGAALISRAMEYQVDRVHKDVTVSLLGLGRSHAVYRGELGCFLDHGDTVAFAPPPAEKP